MRRSKQAQAAVAEAFSSAVDDGVAATKELATTGVAQVSAKASSLAKHETATRSVASRLPEPIRFALVVVLSFTLSALAQSFLGEWTGGELATIARQPESRTEVAVLTAWRILELALGWFGNYDGYDLAALTLLSHGPGAYLTSEFYGIRALTAAAYLGVDALSAFIPFVLLRQLSGAHSAARGVPNREIVLDKTLEALTAILSGLIYSVVLFLACRTYLPTVLVVYFNGIPTVQPAVETVPLGLDRIPTHILSLLFGLAARAFIFTPLVTTPHTLEDDEVGEFDPVSATFGQTLYWNLWGYTTQTKVAILRTAVVMFVTAVSTYLQCAMMINGVESYGAVMYAAIWVVAAMVTGLSLRYVGSV
ncbi:hypothetical protein QBC46DRAFT_157740 [Diplogelasinospora grovesii]|uniref:Uncharacterized protein n=1 Tax=Diplogelasinospora grovesii TaxID=303347 RepID=A0AAN6S8R4_9PEZI|nr:hypothetical protein QBC46DRAFT_157740 [Diplogelasinospora grovesii]